MRIGKATTTPPGITEGSGDEHDAERIAEQLTFEWAAIYPTVEEMVEAAYAQAAERALSDLGISDKEMFDRINQDAVEFAQSRAAELIGKKWVAGQLIENPDARWAITETTREDIRQLVLKALTDGASVDELEQMIEDSSAFSEMRAEMVARTELGLAHVNGNIAAWERSEVVSGYEWILGSEHEIADECDDNAGEFVALGGVFPSGDAGPPLHPNCVCALLPRLIEET